MDPKTDPMLDVFEDLVSAGFTTSVRVAVELNRIGYPAPRGGKWRPQQVLQKSYRLAAAYPSYTHPFVRPPKKEAPPVETRITVTMMERMQARTIRPKLDFLAKHGATDPAVIAKVLNKSGVPGFRGKHWTAATAKILIELAYAKPIGLLATVKPVALLKK